MAPAALVERVVALFPEFQAHWDDPSNCFRDDDGKFTLHGVFAVFTHFFKDRHASLPPDRIAALGAFVSHCMESGSEDLGNAAATCFVENIAGEGCDRELSRHLTGAARTYWRFWSGNDGDDIGG
jgi:hypothetical protein